MSAKPHSRRSHAAILWAQGVWGGWIAFAWTVLYGVFAAWRSEFVKSNLQDQYQVPAMLSHIPLVWGIVVLVLLIAGWVFEASYRAYRSASPSNNVADSKSLLLINRQVFTRQDVPLDGHHYLNCLFHDVTFVFNGGYFKLTYCSVTKPFDIRTDKVGIREFLNMLLVGRTLDAGLKDESGALSDPDNVGHNLIATLAEIRGDTSGRVPKFTEWDAGDTDLRIKR
jgi:hypothetical protein